MDEIVRAAQEISYSDKDIKNLLDNKVNIITYPELSKIKDLDELFPNGYPCIILYITEYKTIIPLDEEDKEYNEIGNNTNYKKSIYGHWTCLLKNGNNSYEFFDPYGIFPDEELKFIPEKVRLVSKQYRKYLSNLIKLKMHENPETEVIYNKYQLQDMPSIEEGRSKETLVSFNTCGRWCALRAYLKRFNLKEFISLFTAKSNKMEPDMIVTYLTLLNR